MSNVLDPPQARERVVPLGVRAIAEGIVLIPEQRLGAIITAWLRQGDGKGDQDDPPPPCRLTP